MFNLGRAITIFKKELIDTLRDRRTLLVTILFPLLLFPIIISVTTSFTISQIEKEAARVPNVAVIFNGNGAELKERLLAAENINIIEDFGTKSSVYVDVDVDEVDQAIQDGEIDLAIVLDPGFDEAVKAGKAGTLTLYHKTAEGINTAKSNIQSIISTFEDGIVKKRFDALGIDYSINEAVKIEDKNVATIQEIVGTVVGGFIPYIFILFCFMGCMYPAIDLAAGEKERGTLETLLTTPASKLEILFGKLGVVTLSGLFAGLTSILSLYISIQFMLPENADIPKHFLDAIWSLLDPGTVALLLSLLVPLSIFFAGILLSLSVSVKSFKEAQTLITPFTIVVILPAALGMLPGVSLDGITALVPILNISMATKEIISGTVNPLFLAEVYLALIFFAGISLYVSQLWFKREETIFG